MWSLFRITFFLVNLVISSIVTAQSAGQDIDSFDDMPRQITFFD